MLFFQTIHIDIFIYIDSYYLYINTIKIKKYNSILFVMLYKVLSSSSIIIKIYMFYMYIFKIWLYNCVNYKNRAVYIK